MFHKLLFACDETMFGMEPEFVKYLCAYFVVEQKIVRCDLLHNIIRYGQHLLLAIFLTDSTFKLDSSPFKKKSYDLFFRIICYRFTLNRLDDNRGHNRQIFWSRIFVPVLEVLLLPQLIHLVVKDRLTYLKYSTTLLYIY